MKIIFLDQCSDHMVFFCFDLKLSYLPVLLNIGLTLYGLLFPFDLSELSNFQMLLNIVLILCELISSIFAEKK